MKTLALNRIASILMSGVLLALSGCASVPSTIVQQPTSTRPLYPEPQAPNNGAIYQVASYRPMFEDRRARHIGDILTINIVERTSAGKNGASSGSKSGEAGFKVPGPLASKIGANVALETENKFSDADTQSASNTFSGTIGVTVTEVLSNGNLIVAGEKQVALNKGVEYIRFSGMINPDSIGSGNVVPSTQVADARVEYRTASRVDRAEVMAMATRFFQSVLPF